jgi:hypothetical protein
MIPPTEKNVLSTKQQMPPRLCNYTKFQIMLTHSKENVYFFLLLALFANRKQKEIRKRGGKNNMSFQPWGINASLFLVSCASSKCEKVFIASW